ncbi:MAG: glutathione peroxidase [Bacteroidales bacterium]|jgi:glutathione peroxidase|nr:glutathione peroxidase [Bacteroidales bacterium]
MENTIYDFEVKNDKNEITNLSIYKDKVLLIVNTATKCGLTPQYEALEALYEKYKDRGFFVLDFPCNQFLEQAPGTIEEISEFCTLKYNTTFPRFGKIDVNGEDTHPLFAWLKKEKPLDKGGIKAKIFEKTVSKLVKDKKEGDIKWNFGKFLIDRNGKVIERYSPAYKPEKLIKDIEAIL